MTKTIVVLAAGMSSRMKKSADSEIDDKKADEANKKSKSLITFGNKPFIYFLLKNISNAGFENIFLKVIEILIFAMELLWKIKFFIIFSSLEEILISLTPLNPSINDIILPFSCVSLLVPIKVIFFLLIKLKK